MSNITKKEQYTYYDYTFSKNECSIINAHVSKSVDSIPEHDLLKRIGVSIIKALKTIGQSSKSDQDIQFITSGVFDYVLKHRMNLRIEEVILAIDLGSLGEYGEDVVYVSVKNVIKWLKEYAQQKINTFKVLTTQKEKYEHTEALNDSEIKQVEYWQNFPKNLNDEFMSYKVSGELTNIAWIFVKNLEEIGYTDFLDIDLETKKKMYQEEKENAIRRKREELSETYIVITPKLLAVEPLDKEIKKECKLRALKMWFDKIEFIDIEKIEQLIKQS